MPRSYDLNPVSITHHPTQRIDTAIGKLPPFDIQQIVDGFLTALKDLTGIDLTGIRDFLENVFGSIDWSDLPTPEAVWGFVVTTFIKTLNIFSIPADVQASINESLGHLQDALEGNYEGSGPIFLAVQALAEAWLKATDPLNAANLFGRIGMPQLAGGVSLADLTTATSNLLDPFTAESVPSSDGWSFNPGQDAAQVVADGSTKGLWLKSGVIKVEEGQPVNTTVKVKYSGISSGAGQAIRYVLETYESEDGSGPMVPVVVGAITNPSGTVSSPVTLGDTSWGIPVGVQSVRPLLEVDELVTAGTVYWLNTPVFRKTLLGVLSDGLPAALQKPLDDLQATWDKFKGAAGGTVDDIEDALDDAGQAIRDAIANALGHAGAGHTSAQIATYLANIPQGVVTGLTDLATQTNQIVDILAGNTVTAINATVQAVKDWFNSWFGGGSSNAIPLSQKGAANGVAPLNSSTKLATTFLETNVANGVPKLTSGGKLDLSYVQTNGLDQLLQLDGNGLVPTGKLPNLSGSYLSASQKGAANGVAPLNVNSVVPLINLPEEVGGSGGSGDGRPYVILYIDNGGVGGASVPNNTETNLPGLGQIGSASVTFENSSNTRFRFNTPGMWLVTGQIAYNSTSGGTGFREGILRREIAFSGSPLTITVAAVQFPAIAGRIQQSSFTAMVRVANYSLSSYALSENDWFSFAAWQNSGSTLTAGSSGGTNTTMMTCIYLGLT